MTNSMDESGVTDEGNDKFNVEEALPPRMPRMNSFRGSMHMMMMNNNHGPGTAAPHLRTSRRMLATDGTADQGVLMKPKEQVVYDYDVKNYVHEKPMREWRFTIPGLKDPIIMNPVTTMIGIVPLWTASIWCMVSPQKALDTLVELRGKIALSWTWFVIVTKPTSLFFLLWITYKYGDIKFGGKDSKPEFGNVEYFSMIFTTGVGVGMYVYGVSEPLWHQSSHWFAEAGYRSQDEIDQMAMVITVYHWGFHAFATYLTVAIATSLASYRFRLPLIFRSTFYPILGEYTWGYLGDLIDGLSIVVTIGGICTSLGLGAIQMTAGIQRIGWLDEGLSESEITRTQIIVIWFVTIMTTASVLMGLSVGIRYLSMIAFALGIFLSLAVFMMDQTSHLMNLTVQTIGYYFQISIFQLPFHTDAYGQLRPGEGRATDGNASATWWFDAWTIFYWNWWVAWSVFVGLFVARLSYGRTLREVTLYSLVAPVFYLLHWFCIWGGAGLRQARQALELQQLGKTYYNDTQYFQSAESEFCYDVPQDDIMVEGEEQPIFTNYLKGVTPVCVFESTNAAAFNVLYSFSFPEEWDTGYGPYLSVLFLIALATYFATSSDSGSLVVDFLAANGRHTTHWIQRLFWALTEASVATALLSAGGSNALQAVQAASIICGLPYTVILTFLLQSIYEMCEQSQDEERIHFEPPKRQFIMPTYGGVFNVFEYMASFGRVHTARVILGMDLPSTLQVSEFFTSLFLPFLALQDILFSMYPDPKSKYTNALLLVLYTIFFFFWAVAFPMSAKWPSMVYWGWGAYVGCACILGKLKNSVRLRKRLHGNFVGDLLSSFLLYPQVLTQIRIELLEYGSEQVPEDKKSTKPSHQLRGGMGNHGDLLGESTHSSRPRRRKMRRNKSNDSWDDESLSQSVRSSAKKRRNSKRHLAQNDDSGVMPNARDTDSMGTNSIRGDNSAAFLETDSLGTSSRRGDSSAFREAESLGTSSRRDKKSAKRERQEEKFMNEFSKLAEDRFGNTTTHQYNSSDGELSDSMGAASGFNKSSSRRRSSAPISITRAPTGTSGSVTSKRSAADVRAEFRKSQIARTKPPVDLLQGKAVGQEQAIPKIIEA